MKKMTAGTILITLATLVLMLAAIGCESSESESGEHGSRAESGENRESSESGEHGGESESGEHNEGSESGEGDEESGTQFTLSESYDEVRAGARLKLTYDSTANAFVGTVENTTGATLSRVRVEVHLSNGTELGPTTPTDLAPGQVLDIELPTSSQPFVTWSAHPDPCLRVASGSLFK